MVTGEAVPLDLRIAQLPSRSMAIAVDLTIQIALLVGVCSCWPLLPAAAPTMPP